MGLKFKPNKPNKILFIALFPITYLGLLALFYGLSLHSPLALYLYSGLYYLNPTPWFAEPNSMLPFSWLYFLGGVSFWTFIGCTIALLKYRD